MHSVISRESVKGGSRYSFVLPNRTCSGPATSRADSGHSGEQRRHSPHPESGAVDRGHRGPRQSREQRSRKDFVESLDAFIVQNLRRNAGDRILLGIIGTSDPENQSDKDSEILAGALSVLLAPLAAATQNVMGGALEPTRPNGPAYRFISWARERWNYTELLQPAAQT